MRISSILDQLVNERDDLIIDEVVAKGKCPLLLKRREGDMESEVFDNSKSGAYELENIRKWTMTDALKIK